MFLLIDVVRFPYCLARRRGPACRAACRVTCARRACAAPAADGASSCARTSSSSGSPTRRWSYLRCRRRSQNLSHTHCNLKLRPLGRTRANIPKVAVRTPTHSVSVLQFNILDPHSWAVLEIFTYSYMYEYTYEYNNWLANCALVIRLCTHAYREGLRAGGRGAVAGVSGQMGRPA